VPRKSFAVLEASDIAIADSIFRGPNFKAFIKQGKKGTTLTFLYTFQFLGENQEYSLVVNAADVKKDSVLKIAGLKTRSYEGRELYEIKTKENKSFTLVFYENHCHISSHSLLAEEVVRQYKTVKPSFEEENPKLFGHPALQNDLGNLYLNWQELSKAFKKNSFLESESEYLSRLCQSAVMDFQVENKNFLFSGFGIDSTRSVNSFLTLFQSQNPVPVRMLLSLPDQFDLLLHLGLADAKNWYGQKLKYQEGNPEIGKKLLTLRADFSLDDQALFSAFDNELAKIKKGDAEAMVVELKEVTKAVTHLNQVIKAAEKKKLHREEKYGSSTIHSLFIPDVGYALFWPFMKMAPQTHYAIVDQYLIVSPNEDYVKMVIGELNGDNTIGKSLSWQKFLSNAQEESNVSLLLNNESNSFGYSFNRLILQFTRLDRNYYSSAFVTFPQSPQGASYPTKTVDASVGATPFRGEVVPVINHNSNAVELLAQEQSNDLVLIDAKNNSLWRRKMESPWADKIYQVDFLGNGKLQYLVATSSQLNIIDRLGRDVDGFSAKLSAQPDFVSVVDYNNTKDYRFMVSTKSGDITLYDKKGKKLEGWSPKSLKMDLLVAPHYFRIAHKDYFAAVGHRGDVFLFNRRAEAAPGFPLSTRMEPAGGLFANNQHLIFCSKDGHLLRITPKGRIDKDEVLLKNGNDARFGLCASQDESDFIVFRLERGQLGIFDSGENLIFDVANPASENLIIRYHTFNRVKLISAYDPDQQLYFLLDLKGKSLLKTPLESSVIPGIAYDKKTGTIQVFFAKGNSISTLKIDL
jgi:hypothetical protein